jgi:hypothetical protein
VGLRRVILRSFATNPKQAGPVSVPRLRLRKTGAPPQAADPHPAGDEVIVRGVGGFTVPIDPTPGVFSRSRFPRDRGSTPPLIREIERAGKGEGTHFPGRRMRLPMGSIDGRSCVPAGT